MIEYIPRQAAIAAVIEARMPDTTPDGTPIANGKRSVSDCVRRIRDIPAADIQPVKHGRWIDGDCRCVTAVCSNCNRLRLGNGAKSAMRLALYCEKCGARMDGET